jgi:hypothetical protein
MFRKLSLAAVAAIALGSAALAPTSASAWGHGGGWHGGGGGWHGGGWRGGWHGGGWRGGWWGGGPGFYGVYGYPAADYGYGCRRWVPTPYGPQPRWVC